MSTYSASEAASFDKNPSTKVTSSSRISVTWRAWPAAIGIAAGAAWFAFAFSSLWWVDRGDWPRTHDLAMAAFVLSVAIFIVTAGTSRLGRFGAGVQQRAPWLLVLGLFFTLWELATAKFAWLPLPFFPPPQSILEVYTDDLPKLLASVIASVKLQLGGYAIGAVAGFLTGVSIGWSRSIGYWVHPVLRFIGPLPATAWLPIAFFTFPSSWSASTFLIALATGFPVTVLTWSGVASVSPAYYDVARTLGAKPSFLILKVAIPAALPHVFVGLFMGLGASFAVLVVAEMMGVKAGLGWYLQ